jgi:predicted metal-dependent hydrolase
MNPDVRWDNPVVEVRRSARRKRTVSAYLRDGVIVVMIPASASKADEEEYVALMVAKLRRSEQRRTPSDTGLLERAQSLNEQYLDGKAVPASVRWVDNMTTRWASCTIQTREIRVSRQVQSMPAWVLDYVLIHELAHILVPGHGPDFWALANRHPRTETAKAFLMGVTHGAKSVPRKAP